MLRRLSLNYRTTSIRYRKFMEQIDHILVVDDDQYIRELVAAYLRKNGLRASTVASGREMWATLDICPVDLIVLDVIMPGDDGLLLCRNLRTGKHRSVPIVMLTSRDDETDR